MDETQKHMTEKESKNKKCLSKFGGYFMALIFSSGVSFALATYWLEISPGWLALLLGAVFSIIGSSLGENIGDAIIFSLIVAVLVTVFITAGPQITIIRAAVIPVATGLCTGKLVAGIFKEASP